MDGIQINGLEEIMEDIDEMILTESDERKVVREGIKVIGKNIEDNTPKNKGKLSKVNEKVKRDGLGWAGIANSKMFYDIFEEFGTSQQKKNVGYFDKAVRNGTNEAIELASRILFSKIK